jgi:hypothetical protein
MITLRQFMSCAAREASALFARQGNQLRPMYHAIDRNGRDVVFAAARGPSDFLNQDGPRLTLADIGASRVVFIDEAWIVSGAKANLDLAVAFGASVHPRRVEVLLLAGEDQLEGSLMATRDIIRTGNRVVLGALSFLEPDVLSGRMAGLLPAKSRVQ